ncbi:hypothetical protein CEE55_22415 [Stenotrophomonas pavanii]|uniref:Uncharacterized protein n=1 Tax=Stenotrophomonas pavanii TaxID=487698 RepID=A0A246KR27_9GAMM|nr:hypothetical protein [Stenotrophomonas pavanii]OWR25638.1 hypothetical protein CEE55_22415 [Stenotrophomonas pavanii]
MKAQAKHWPDHPAIGRHISVNSEMVEILDVKPGPMTFNSSDLATDDIVLHGTLKLRVLFPDGRAQWLPPVDGEGLLVHLDITDYAKAVQERVA